MKEAKEIPMSTSRFCAGVNDGVDEDADEGTDEGTDEDADASVDAGALPES